ncbi:MAG: hypothetical protein JXA09_15115 [Anaerolineae bacterium]|nr:hypothetical protein [Anaerolineae bacterium]
MMVTQRDYLAQKEYYADQARAAARDRFARMALAGHPVGERPVCRALAWIGARLVAWGTSLRQEYGQVIPQHIPQSAHPANGQ